MNMLKIKFWWLKKLTPEERDVINTGTVYLETSQAICYKKKVKCTTHKCFNNKRRTIKVCVPKSVIVEEE